MTGTEQARDATATEQARDVTWTEQTKDALEQAGVDLVAYLPDTTLAPLIEALDADDSFETVLVTREEEAVGILSGAWVGGRRGALLCQSSGLVNTFNALGSLSVPAQLPFVGLVTRRGDLGEFNRAQVPAGAGMEELLDAVGVRHHSLDSAAEVETRVRMAAETAFSTELPYVVLLEATLTGYKSEETESGGKSEETEDEAKREQTADEGGAGR